MNQKEQDVKAAIKFAKTCKYFKISLGLLIAICYFWYPSLLLELVVTATIVSLLLPMGFSDTFLEKLIEYERSLLEERQILNANEANDHFKRLFDRTDKIRRDISGYGYKQ